MDWCACIQIARTRMYGFSSKALVGLSQGYFGFLSAYKDKPSKFITYFRITTQSRDENPGLRSWGPASSPGRKAVFFGVRARVFTELRGSILKSGRRGQENGGWKAFHPRFRGFSGALWDEWPFWGGKQELFLKNKPAKKGLFFLINRRFWGCF